MEIVEAEVIIVGAGPVGLALSIELGLRGIKCVLIEQNDGVGHNPRAKLTNVRSREHLRRWGIADSLRVASPMPSDYPSDVVFVTRMNGHLLARFDNVFNCRRENNNLYSEPAQWVPQYTLEQVLLEKALSLPNVDIRFLTRLKSFEQNEAEVTAVVFDTVSGKELKLRGSYLVGADGGRSVVRETLGIGMRGKAGISRNYNVQFRAPALSAMHGFGQAIQYWLVNADVPSLMGPMDGDSRWYIIATKLAGDVDPASIDPRELIRRATGLDFEMEVTSTDPWVAHSLIADRYADARIYLAGDACHLHPPFGGFGMNMGIGDAVDLGWKLAASLQGWGGSSLLKSYEQERRPIHEFVLNEAAINYATVGNQLVRPGLEDPGPLGQATRKEVSDTIAATKLREFRTLGVVLGLRYKESPIVVSDGSDPPIEHFMHYQPSAHPGCLAPHLWLADGTSLYDHFGKGFSLLVTDKEGLHEAQEVVAQSARLAIPLQVVVPSDDRLRDRYAARFALIRPDQHVAWRGDTLPSDTATLLDHIRGAR